VEFAGAVNALKCAVELQQKMAKAKHGGTVLLTAQGKRLEKRSRQESVEAERLARRAAELGRDDAVALYAAGMVLAKVVADLDGHSVDRSGSRSQSEFSVGLAPQQLGRAWAAEPELAIEHEGRAMRLSPHDPLFLNLQATTALAHFFAAAT